MIILRRTLFLMVLAAGVNLAWGQDSTNPPQPDSGQTAQPAPAYGSGNQVPSISENPPISGLDLPNLEPHAAPLSYLQAGAHVSESADTNIEDTLGGSHLQSVTRAEGSLELMRLWSNYTLSLQYLGGVGNYNVRGIGIRQVEELGLYQKVSWKRGQFGVRDAFSYQPEGAFGSSYGSTAAAGAGLGDISVFFGGSTFGALGQVPRIMNVTVADAVETLTPKSSITGSFGYGFVHFLENEPGTGNAFIGNSQYSGQAGYSRVLGPHDQGALVYGYQDFQFSTGVSFQDNVLQLMWGHRISGRMDFIVGAGPQFTQLTNDLIISTAGQAQLRYQFPRATLSASFRHFITNGSGFFAGAESDIASLGAARPLTRTLSVSTDLGYSRNSRLTPELCAAGCPGVSADVYQYGFAGIAFHRMFGRNFHGFASFQFNELSFDHSYCGAADCSRISNREIGTIGLDWTPRPIRLD
jgi:hypothetical protein